MIIKRLKLENWRGIDSREVTLSEGVTLIEGPNEIGKSTIVEAVRTLFTTKDSSGKKEIHAIQPKGTDVGSQVEAEILTGDYHFIYGKTFNKDKQTYLHILTPQPQQLTGLDAHERAEQILNETVDMTLWDALLVEQGKEVAGAHLANSRGLAKALDKAAGSASAQLEDTDLFAAVQDEYEKYFTLITGRPKYLELKRECDAAKNLVETIREALAATENDTLEHERCSLEIQRLNAAVPELHEKVKQHESDWSAIDKLQTKTTAKSSEVESTRLKWEAATKDQNQRKSLIKEVDSNAENLAIKQHELIPFADKVEKLGDQRKDAETESVESNKSLNVARVTLELARQDQRHLEQAETLKAVHKRLEKLEELQKKATQARSIISGIKIDSKGVSELREAERQLQIARAKRDALASVIEIEAKNALGLSWGDGGKRSLSKGEVEQRSIASEASLEILDVATIRFTPSQPAAELENELEQSDQALSKLLENYNVKNLSDAVVAAGTRADAERDLKDLNANMRELLGDDSKEDLDATVTALKADQDLYIANRSPENEMPGSLEDSVQQLKEAEQTFGAFEKEAELKRETLDELKENFNKANAESLVRKQEIEGLKADLKRRQATLEEMRLSETDDQLEAKVVEHAIRVEQLEKELHELTTMLEEAMPEAAEMLLNNSRDALNRAEKDLNERRLHLAVLDDRLVNAQANGRFEDLEMAERDLEELQAQHDSTESRAEAAKLLWKTLNKHRDETRQAYLRPLKDSIERFGKIVFGAGFSVDVGDDWTLVSRTLNGKTIPFEDLSVGAKEQLGILTRLAAAQMVSSDGGVPLIIDDALGFSDPTRLESMGAAISSAGKDCQIILLTCTPGRFQNVGSAEVVRFETELPRAT